MGFMDWAGEGLAYSQGYVLGKDAIIDKTVKTIAEKADTNLSETTKDIVKQHFHGIADNYFLKTNPESGQTTLKPDEFKAGVGNFSLFMHEVGQHAHMGGAIVEMAKNPALMESFTDAFIEDRDLLDKMGPALQDPKTMAAFKDAIARNPNALKGSFAHMAASPESIPQALQAVTGKPAESYAGIQVEEGMDLIATVTSVDKAVKAVEKVAADNPDLKDAVDKFKQDVVANEGGIQGKLLSVATAAPSEALEGGAVGNSLLAGFIKNYAENPAQALDNMSQTMPMVRESMAFLNKMHGYALQHGYTEAEVKATTGTLVKMGPELIQKFAGDNKELQQVGGMNSPSVMEGLLDLQKAGKLEEALSQEGGEMLRMEIAMEHAERLITDQLAGQPPSANVQKLLNGLENDPELRQLLWDNKDAFNKMMNTGGEMAGMLGGKTPPLDWVAEKYANGEFVGMAKEKGLDGMKVDYMKDSFGAYGSLMAGMSTWAEGLMSNLGPMLEAMMGRLMGFVEQFIPAFASSGFVSKLTMGAENGNLLGEFDNGLAGAVKSFGHSVETTKDLAEMRRLAKVLEEKGPTASLDSLKVNAETGNIQDPDEELKKQQQASTKPDPMKNNNPHEANDPTPTVPFPIG